MWRSGCKGISGIAVKLMFSDNLYIFLRFLRGCRGRHIRLDQVCLHSSPGTALSHRKLLHTAALEIANPVLAKPEPGMAQRPRRAGRRRITGGI